MAQDWPAKPVTLVVPYTAGGSADAIGRRLGDVLRKESNITVIVENKPGAGASVGTDVVARAQPDGTTLLLASTSPLTIYPHLAKTNYDPLKDLTPLASVAVAPVAIVATKALPVKDFAGLIEFAKSRPDGVRYGTPGQGTVAHIGMSALTAQTGTKMLHVPYRGNSQALTDGLGGVVELLVINSDVVLPHGQRRAQAAGGDGAATPGRLAGRAHHGRTEAAAAAVLLELRRVRPGQAVAGRGAVGAGRAGQGHRQRRLQDLLAKSYLQPGTAAGDAFVKQVQDEYASNARVIKEGGIKAE